MEPGNREKYGIATNERGGVLVWHKLDDLLEHFLRNGMAYNFD